MVQQTVYQTGYEMYTLNNVYTTMYLNNVFKQCIETMLKDNSIFHMPMLLFSLWFSVNNTVHYIHMPIITSIWIARARTRGGKK
jgi:hypothetical protein